MAKDNKKAEESKHEYFGLWLTESKSGTKYLSGYDKETKRSYKVFKSKEGVQRLCTTVGDDGDMITLGEFKEIPVEGKSPIHVIGDVFLLGENRFYQEGVDAGKKPPEYNLRILKDY